MKKISILFIFLVFVPLSILAQGMWTPFSILNQRADMKNAGIKIDPFELYDPYEPAYNDAVVLFGGGCTGGMVSKNGLLFTNHHCGYSYGQSLSNSERNILKDGFWAKNMSEEIPCPGLTVSFVRRIDNVTNKILAGVSDSMPEIERMKIIEKNITEFEKSYSKTTGQKAEVKPFFDGNEYWVTIMEVYSDVRLVAFPPNGIGKFGGDTDNWMWPRHTGDFAVFRVYADKNGKPNGYSKTNIPYTPKKHFNISTKGVKENDFSMVYGFPAKTTQYISSYQVEQIQKIIDPIRIDLRTIRLNIWDKEMRKNEKIFLKYAAKQSSVSNGWKKWQGEIRGLEINNVIDIKRKREEALQIKFNYSKAPEVDLLSKIEALILANNDVVAAIETMRESVLSIEIINAAQLLDRAVAVMENKQLSSLDKRKELEKIHKSYQGFYKNYEWKVDKQVFLELMPIYFESKKWNGLAPQLEIYANKYYSGNFSMWADNLYENSILQHPEAMERILRDGSDADIKRIKNDPAYVVYKDVIDYRNSELLPKYEEYTIQLNKYNREFTKAQIYMASDEKKLYPDANQTLRLSYGPVKGIQPYMSNQYSYITTLDEVISKTNLNNEDFNTPQGLLDLYFQKDFGRWATENGKVPVCFLTQNHTSGGNSGSPVLNANGELIGINFDRIWDGTMSDIYFDPNLCRNIVVDVRYVLFILEKYGKMDWLLKEMNLK